MTENHKMKISARLKGRKHSATHNMNVSKAHRGVKLSDEHKEAIKEGMKRYFQENKKKKILNSDGESKERTNCKI